jgi:PAS domain S-box-containing protein
MFFVLPIALLAIEFGLGGGLLAAVAATGLVVGWEIARHVGLETGEVVLVCALLALVGTALGLLGDRITQTSALVADQVLYMEGLTAHGLVRLDSSGSITGWNRGATEILGYSEADARSQPLALILGGETEAGALPGRMLDGAVRSGLWDEERWVVDKGGRRHWAALSVTPLADGGDAGFALVLRDLTAARAARHESLRMWDVSTEMLATVRFDGYFQRVNPHWGEVLGWTANELVAQPFVDFVHPGDRGRTSAEADKLARSSGKSLSFENRYRARDGSYHWLLWNATASAEDGLIYAAARDITVRKQQEAALEAKEAQLRALAEDLEARVEWRTSELTAANKELEAFSYSIAHDLRAPLRAINGYSHALLEDHGDELPEVAQTDLARVRQASQRMATLIDELLGLSRITRRELLHEPVDLSAFAVEIADKLKTQAAAHEVQVEIEPGLRVIGDPELLRLVLQNLFENAWKFTAETEGARVELSRVGGENGKSTFAVRDNGAGFDMRYSDKLFRPFERLHRQDEYRGTGVGLTTVARVVNRHGGRIWADGTPGKGAAFYFELPTGREPHA